MRIRIRLSNGKPVLVASTLHNITAASCHCDCHRRLRSHSCESYRNHGGGTGRQYQQGMNSMKVRIRAVNQKLTQMKIQIDIRQTPSVKTASTINCEVIMYEWAEIDTD